MADPTPRAFALKSGSVDLVESLVPAAASTRAAGDVLAGVSATPSATPAPARRRTSGSPSTASPPSSRRRAATRPLHGSTASSTRAPIALTRRRPEVRQGFRRGGQQGRGPELRLARQVGVHPAGGRAAPSSLSTRG